MRHLAGLGHRVIAHITGPPNLSVVRTRAEAFRLSAEELGLDPGLLPLRHCPALTAADARDAALAVLAADPTVTAILAGNDLMAMGCYAAASQLGRSCPDSISIIGYNDMPSVEWWRPALTTVRIPQYDIGREAARLLLERIGNGADQAAQQILLPVSLTVRASTAQAPEGRRG
jgi:LacI family transcriptional regulator